MKVLFSAGTFAPPFVPAAEATSLRFENVRFDAGTAAPPSLAISLRRSGSIAAKPLLGFSSALNGPSFEKRHHPRLSQSALPTVETRESSLYNKITFPEYVRRASKLSLKLTLHSGP